MDIDKVIIYAGLTATVLTFALIICQSDRISRYILSPGRLRSKRRQEQLYIIENAISTAVLFIRKYVNDGSFYDWQEERKITDLILADEEIKNLVEDIVIVKTNDLSSASVPSTSTITDKEDGPTSDNDGDGGYDENDRAPEETPFIIGIAKDLKLPKADEWYMHLAFPFQVQNGSINDEKKVYYGRRVQVPLDKFGRYLATAFQKEPKDYTFCFVADASSSLGSDIIGQVVQHSQCQIPVIHEPAWMLMLAFLIQRKALSKDAMEQVLYGLCRLSAQAVKHKVGGGYKTIVFTLPGQGCTAALLPYLQRIFPRERHIFAYSGCITSVKRALGLMEQSGKNYKENKKEMTVPTMYSTDESSMPQNISSSMPIKPLSSKELTQHFSSLPFNEASIVESWMSSVHTFLSMKNERNNGAEYVPFVCRLEFLLNRDDEKQPSAMSSIALKNLLEYICGAALQTLKSNEIDAAESVLFDLFVREFRQDVVIDEKRKSVIEDCVLVHKGMFDGDGEMLPDTVQPSSAGWNLKSS